MYVNNLFMCMKDKGDIPERDEIKPEDVDEDLVSDTAKYKVQVAKEVLDNGEVHVYMDHTQGEGEDIHLKAYFSHCFPDLGLIYWHSDDEDHWLHGDDITMIERHYED